MPATDSGAGRVVERLREIGKQSPELKEAALVYESFLPLLSETDLHVVPVCLTAEQVRRKMEEGIPLLQGIDLEIDPAGGRALMLKLTDSLHRSAGSRAALRIKFAIREERLDAGGLLSLVVEGDREAVGSASVGLGLDQALLRTLAENTLKPAFRAWRLQLSPLSEGIAWNRGVCFICGSAPVIGELRDNNQEKHLRCGMCGADWQFHRLRCIYCGNEDHKTLAFLYSEGEREKYRVEVCEACKGYIKVVTTFSPTPPELLPVEDLATLRFDFIAQNRGYLKRAATP